MAKMLSSPPIEAVFDADEQMKLFPATRYMGSKSKLLEHIWSASSQFSFDSVIDLFSGSGVVSYMYKTHGKAVISNDYMAMDSVITKALIENSKTTLSLNEAEKLTTIDTPTDDFVSDTFRGIYYSDEDNRFIDVVRTNIALMDDPYKKAIAMEALIRTCIKKRPRGIFTYVGEIYNY